MTHGIPVVRSHSEILERATEVARGVIAANAAEIDENESWPQEGIEALLAAGLGGLVVAPGHGGRGHGLLATAQTCEVIGRECASTALCFGMHLVASAVISAKATAGQRQDFLQPIVAGHHLTTLALSEPASGAHFYLPQTKLQKSDSDQYLINGAKSFVTNGGHADSYVVSTVAAEQDAPPGQFSCVLIPASAEGVIWGSPWHAFGMRGNSSLSMQLDDVVIPRENLLGNPGDQIWYVFGVIAP